MFNCFAGMNTEDASISQQPNAKPVIVIHGGAGWSLNASAEIQDAIRAVSYTHLTLPTSDQE